MSSRRVILTGAGSLVGSHILDHLLLRKIVVRAIVNTEGEQLRLGHHYPSLSYPHLRIDVIPLDNLAQPRDFDDFWREAVEPYDALIHTMSSDSYEEADCLTRFINLEIEHHLNLLRLAARTSQFPQRIVFATSFAPFARWLLETHDPRSPGPPQVLPRGAAVMDLEYILATSQASSNIVYDAVRQWMRETQASFDIVSVIAPSIYGPAIWPLENSSDLEEANRYIWNICSNDPSWRSECPPNGIGLFADVRDLAFAAVNASLVHEARNQRFFVAAGLFPARTAIVNLLRDRLPYLRGRICTDPGSSRFSPSYSILLDSIDTRPTEIVLGLTQYREAEETLLDVAAQICELHQRRDWKTVVQS